MVATISVAVAARFHRTVLAISPPVALRRVHDPWVGLESLHSKPGFASYELQIERRRDIPVAGRSVGPRESPGSAGPRLRRKALFPSHLMACRIAGAAAKACGTIRAATSSSARTLSASRPEGGTK